MREVVTSVLGSGGDEAVLDYVAGVLEDEDFEWGEVGAGWGPTCLVWVLAGDPRAWCGCWLGGRSRRDLSEGCAKGK